MYPPLLPRILTAVEELSPEIPLEDPSVVSFPTLLQIEELEELSLEAPELPVDFLSAKLPLSAEAAEAAEAAEDGRQCVPAEARAEPPEIPVCSEVA